VTVDGDTNNVHAALEPIVERLDSGLDACDAFLRLVDLPHVVYFDSAQRNPRLGRYSFVAADPFDFVEQRVDAPDALAVLKAALGKHQAREVPGLPPFQGGAAGLLSYDLGRQIEDLPCPRWDEFHMPALAMGLYDVVLAFDHVAEQSWIISHGLPETDPVRRRRRAVRRLQAFRDRLRQTSPNGSPPLRRTASETAALPRTALAPQFDVGVLPELSSNLSREDYLRCVERAIEYIFAGDIFQVNLAQRLLYPAKDDTVSLYLRLRQRNPATFAAYFDLGACQLASASPERFLQVRDRQVEARPIKGTRGRTASPEADLFAGDDLQASEKDRAENVMIVDLMRNDLSRVCQVDSVFVAALCQLETYAFVQHLVSEIRGELAENATPIELLRAAMPGGSITGAPKIRAMEIIAELEPTARGAYCGSVGYLGFDGTMDTNILIRTFTCGRGWWQAPVGGGIVAQSTPRFEYEETWHKAEGLLRSLR